MKNYIGFIFAAILSIIVGIKIAFLSDSSVGIFLIVSGCFYILLAFITYRKCRK